MNTTDRGSKQREDDALGCWRMRSQAHSASPLAISLLPAKIGEF